MTLTNAELNGEFNELGLNIQVEAKTSEEHKQKGHLREKICLYYTKFDNFTRENSLNSNSNHRGKCRIQWWIQRYLFGDWNHGENRRTKETFARENLEELHKNLTVYQGKGHPI